MKKLLQKFSQLQKLDKTSIIIVGLLLLLLSINIFANTQSLNKLKTYSETTRDKWSDLQKELDDIEVIIEELRNNQEE